MRLTATGRGAGGAPGSGSGQYIELIGKAIVVLEALSGSPQSLNLREISAKTRLGKSTVHRILHSLARHGYVEQERPGGPFVLGAQLLLIARGVRAGRTVVESARPFIRRLMETFRQNTCLAVLHRGHILFLEVLEANLAGSTAGPSGNGSSNHSVAAGKAIAAYAPPSIAARLLAPAEGGPAAIRTASPLAMSGQDRTDILRMGYAVHSCDTFSVARVIAAPVFDARDTVCGSVSLGCSGSSSGGSPEKGVVKELKSCCLGISRTLKDAGYVHRHSG